jgi:hypothetical protein
MDDIFDRRLCVGKAIIAYWSFGVNFNEFSDVLIAEGAFLLGQKALKSDTAHIVLLVVSLLASLVGAWLGFNVGIRE